MISSWKCIGEWSVPATFRGILTTEYGMLMSIAKMHDLLGDAGEEARRKTAQVFGWVLMQVTKPPCKSCTVAKAKQKNICKSNNGEKAKKPTEFLFSD